MEAISAIDSVEKESPTMIMKYIQIPPAVPPLVRGMMAAIRAMTQPFPRMSE
jgi:hypothetical protein